jgi:hypothetical protein
VRAALYVLFLAGTQCCAQTAAVDIPEANPGRPTVATPATLTPVGYLQFETGVVAAWDSPEFSSRQGLNETIKLAVHKRLQFLVLMEPIAHGRPDDTAARLGDASLGVQAVLFPGEGRRPTVSVSYFRQIRNGGAPDFDIGSSRDSFLLMFSNDMGGFHIDVNGLLNQQADSGVRAAQYGQTVSVSHPVKKFTIAGELWHFSQPFLKSNAVGNLWAVSYPVRKNLVLDTGFDHGFTYTSTRWEVFAGFTYLLPHRVR